SACFIIQKVISIVAGKENGVSIVKKPGVAYLCNKGGTASEISSLSVEGRDFLLSVAAEMKKENGQNEYFTGFTKSGLGSSNNGYAGTGKLLTERANNPLCRL